MLDLQQHYSKCPIENGAIRSIGSIHFILYNFPPKCNHFNRFHFTDYGTFTPGTVIASIAAGLQPQNVPMNEIVSHEFKRSQFERLESMQSRDTERELQKLLRSLDRLDNAYSANLAGDLAEICVYQGPYTGANTSIGVSGRWNDTYLPRIR